MLKYETPSCFYKEKCVDYEIRKVSICPQTTSKGVLQRTLHYNDSSMYAAVGDINYIAESVVQGKTKRLHGKSVSLKISNLTIAQYVQDINLLPNDVSAMVVFGCCS